jgi:hypothetical protein
VRANLAVLIFSLKKKEACFFRSWKEGVPMLVLLFLLKIDMSDMKIRSGKKQSPRLASGKMGKSHQLIH